MMSSNLVQSITDRVFGTAVAGFGFGIGRDVWKWIKSGGLSGFLYFMISICALFGGFFGARGLVRGHNRGVIGTIFKTIFLNLVLICIATLCSFLVMVVIVYIGVLAETTDSQSSLFSALIVAAGLELIMVICGLIAGLFQRKKRITAFKIERQNESFLKQAGIRETGGKDVTHVDADGTDLRLIETLNDRLIFMVVGKRGRRAYIYFDDEGRMTDYSEVDA